MKLKWTRRALEQLVGTREWVVQRTPYFLVYKLEQDELIVLRVIHGKQNWP